MQHSNRQEPRTATSGENLDVVLVEEDVLDVEDEEDDADLTPEEEAAYAAESARYVVDGPPPEVVEAFRSRAGRPRVGDQPVGASPRLGVRVAPATRDEVQEAAAAEGVSEAEWLRAAIEDGLRKARRRRSVKVNKSGKAVSKTKGLFSGHVHRSSRTRSSS